MKKGKTESSMLMCLELMRTTHTIDTGDIDATPFDKKSASVHVTGFEKSHLQCTDCNYLKCCTSRRKAYVCMKFTMIL